MRKKLAVVFILLNALVLASCEPEVHVHDFNCGRLLERKEASCMLDGYEIHQCASCNAQQITKLDAIGSHNCDEGTISTVSGHEVTTYKCTRCAVIVKTVQEHRLQEEYSHDELNHWKEYACGCEGRQQEGSHLWSVNIQTLTTATGEHVKVTRKTCQICQYESLPTAEIIQEET